MRVTVTNYGNYNQINEVNWHTGVASIITGENHEGIEFLVLKGKDGLVIDAYPMDDIKKIRITMEEGDLK